MINLHEIESTIELIKRDGTSIGDARDLALMYIALDHMRSEAQGEKMSESQDARNAPSPPVVPGYHGDVSDFILACVGVPIDLVLDVLDEHMEAVRVLYPKEYEKVIRMIRER